MLQSRVRRGELDREISFIKKVIEDASNNEDKEVGWEYIATDSDVWARVMVMRGKEMVIADRLTFVQTTVFTVDFRDDINTRMRVQYNSKTYEIISIAENESGRERYLDIAANILDTETIVPDINGGGPGEDNDQDIDGGTP